MLHTMNQEVGSSLFEFTFFLLIDNCIQFRDRTDGDSSDDEVRGVVFKRAWDQEIADDAHLLFGFGWHQTIVDIHTLHPQPFQIFQLWQVYLDNVDPLLKITHTHSLQKRLIAAATNLMTITPELEALMFGIYCMAISSLTENECRAMFASSKVDLLPRFQLGCQQALLNSRFMRSTNRDCLTALCLYLVRTSIAYSPFNCFSNGPRYRFDPPLLRSLCHLSLALPFVSRNAWAFTVKLPWRRHPHSRLRWAGGSGGL